MIKKLILKIDRWFGHLVVRTISTISIDRKECPYCGYIGDGPCYCDTLHVVVGG